MKAWPSLTDTSVVKIYREVPALRNNAFREFARCLNLLSRNKFASLLYGLDRQACQPRTLDVRARLALA